MNKLSPGLAALLLAFAAGAAEARQPASRPAVSEVVETPANCQWIDAGDRVQDLWCRDADGRAQKTSTQRRDTRDYADTGCRRGQMNNGVRCVPEATALRQADNGLRYQPMPGSTATAAWWRDHRTADGKWRDPSAPNLVIYESDGYRGSGYRTSYVYRSDDGYGRYGGNYGGGYGSRYGGYYGGYNRYSGYNNGYGYSSSYGGYGLADGYAGYGY